MKMSYMFYFIILSALTVFGATQTSIKTDKLVLGQKTTLQKTLEFNLGTANNPKIRANNGSLEFANDGSTYFTFSAGLPAGAIMAFATNECPAGWINADGSAVSRSTYAALFSAIGTSHGSGDGSMTFNLPDYRAKFLRGKISIPNVTGTGTVAANNATFTGHGFNRTGMKVRITGGTLSGLSLNTDYYVIVVDANTLSFATTLANAYAGTKISISGTNTGVLSQWEDPDSASRVAMSSGGATGSSIGSVQYDDNKPHAHFIVGGGPNTSITANTYMASYTNGYGNDQNYTLTGTTGVPTVGLSSPDGIEGRPKNAYVTYCLKM